MKHHRSYSLPLTVLLLAGLISCAGHDAQTENTTAITSQPAETLESEDSLQSLLPNDLDFGGEEIRFFNGVFADDDARLLHVEESSGDIIDDAVYNRAVNTESKLNVTFSYIDNNGSSTWADTIIRKSVAANANDFDIIFGTQYVVCPLVLENMYYNLADCEYLHLDRPWWYQDYLEELSIGEDMTYFVTGDISLGVLRFLSCIYVNRDMWKTYFESVDEIYADVLNGKWTMDRLSEICKQIYRDLNGNGAYDDDDQYGLGVITTVSVDHFTYNAGVRVTARDEENLPYIVMGSEHTASFTQKLYNLFYENEGVRVMPESWDSLLIDMPNKLNAGELLYLPGVFKTAEYMRDLDVDFTVIPYPKYDESQESYLSVAHDDSIIVCVPTTCTKLDAATAVMEHFAFEGYKSILPAYYEVALKLKYTRDSTDEAIQMLDIIHDNATTDFGYIYSTALDSIGHIERNLMKNQKADFASTFEKSEKRLLKSLEKFIDQYMESNS